MLLGPGEEGQELCELLVGRGKRRWGLGGRTFSDIDEMGYGNIKS